MVLLIATDSGVHEFSSVCVGEREVENISLSLSS